MRKWFSTLIVLAVALSMLVTSCAPAATPTPVPPPTAVKPTTVGPTAVPTPVPVEPVTIRLWHQEGQEIVDAVIQPLVNEFMAANPNVTIELTNYETEDLRTQFQTASLAGDAPEVIRGPNDPIGVFAVMGIVMPIEEMFDQAFLDTFLSGALAGGVLKGTMYGIPDTYGNHLMLLYNKDLVTEVPADWDELIATAQALTDEAAGTWGLAYNTQEPFWLAPFLGGFGGWVLDDATDAPTLNTPEMVNALQFMGDLSNKYKIVPPGSDYNTMDALFKEGKAAMIINGDWSLTGYTDAGLNFGAAAMPPIKATGLYPTPMTSAKFYSISSQLEKGTAKFDMVKQFVEFMAGEDAQQMWLEKTKRLPSNKNVAQSPTILQDPILQGSMAQLAQGRSMPTAPELRCFWDSARPGMQGVIAGTDAPADAAAKMQESADRCIQEAGLGAVIQPKVGQVTDMGGIDDKSFNATAWKGIEDAMEKLGAEGKYLESQVQADYAKNIQQFLDEGLDLIVTVGFLLGVDTATAAKANPDVSFAIVDYAYPDCWPGAEVGKDCGSDVELPNVLGLTFATDEAAFLAGYLAAGMTKTGKVGTFGGIKIPTVTIFMQGFEAGVKYYNRQKGTTVEVLGWDTAKDEGLFTGNFESTDDGRRFGESLMDEGADIIMPVAGPVGLGTAAACMERGTMMIGVDTDQYISAPEFAPVWLTSVEKKMDAAVFEAAKQVAYGYFEGGAYVGTLANNGVGISPFHDYDAQVPGTLKAELEEIKQGLIDGSISISAALLPAVKVGQVTDMGGIDDKSFNATAWKGIEDAMEKLGAEGKYLESQVQADYAKNIQQFLDEGLDLIVTVGFLLGVDTATAAKANPDQKFAIVDYAYPDCWPGAEVGKDCGSDVELPNVLGLTFATDEAAFLAGYLAAGMTKTGKVGTFGGIKIPTVTIFMTGMEAGIKHYNEVHGTTVELLGWSAAEDEGLFTGNFESTDDGRRFGESLMDEGADIIMPVAGPVGLGTAAACMERGTMIIGVDTDQYISAPEFAAVWLTSVLKNMDVAVFDAAKAVQDGTFAGGAYVGTLANDGVGIAPFHEFDAQVPASLKSELNTLKADLIAGTITVNGVLGL